MISRLLFLNALGIFTVVMCHSISWGYTAMFWWTNRYRPVTVPNFDQMGGFSYYVLRAFEQITAFPIPAFLFISGYFIAFAAGRHDNRISWHVVGCRIRQLLPPYLIWSAAMLVMDLQTRNYGLNSGDLLNLWTGRTTDAYYYVPLLCAAYVISPILVPLVRRAPLAALGISALVELALRGIQYPVMLGGFQQPLERAWLLTPVWLFVNKAFWFVAGACASLYAPRLKEWVVRRKYWVISAAVVLYAGGLVEWEWLCRLSGRQWTGPWQTIPDAAFAAVFIGLFLFLDHLRLPFRKILEPLGHNSYGIFLVHPLVLQGAAKALYHVAPWMIGIPLVFTSALLILGLGLPLLLMKGVQSCGWRRAHAYMFGN